MVRGFARQKGCPTTLMLPEYFFCNGFFFFILVLLELNLRLMSSTSQLWSPMRFDSFFWSFCLSFSCFFLVGLVCVDLCLFCLCGCCQHSVIKKEQKQVKKLVSFTSQQDKKEGLLPGRPALRSLDRL